MDNLQVVKAVKKPAIEVMKEKKVLASFIIAASIHHMNTVSEDDAGVLLKANNVMKRKAGKKFNDDTVVLNNERGSRYKKYDSVEDCIEDWLLSFRSSLIKEVWDLDKVFSKLNNKEYSKSNLQQYVDAYKLTDIDKEALAELYPPNQNVVEVPVNVAAANEITTYQTMAGYKPKAPAGTVISKRQRPEPAKPVTYSKGDKFVVRNVNIFYDPNKGVANRSFTGNVWLYDGMLRNGKYAIVTNKDNIGRGKDYIDGYIKKIDLK